MLDLGLRWGPGVIDTVRYFGERDRIFYVHFRDVQGYVPKFAESFVDDGNCDMFEVMRALKESGFTGWMITDHVPNMINDTPQGHRARAFTIGYMAACLERLNAAG